MNSGSASQGPKSFVRSRGASNGTAGNMLSSKNMHHDSKKQNDLQLTPQSGVDESKKKMNTSKQRTAGGMLSPDTAAADISPYNDGKGMTTGKRDQ